MTWEPPGAEPPRLPDPSTTPGTAPPAESKPTSWWRRKVAKLPIWAWILIALVVLGGISSALGGDTNEDADTTSADTASSSNATEAPTTTPATSPAPTPSTTSAPATEPPSTTAAPTTTEPAPTTAPTTTEPPTTTTTLPVIDDGVYIVPDEVAFGTYRVGSYWALLDPAQEIIDNDLNGSECLTLVVVDDRASYIEISGQAIALEFLPTFDPIANACTGGTFLVGVDIQPGQYRVNPDETGAAYWARLDGQLQLIDNDFQTGQSIMVIQPGDFAIRFTGTLELIA